MARKGATMPFYVGIGKHRREFRFDETTGRLWVVTVNGKRQGIYCATEQAVMEHVSSRFYWDDWHIEPYKFLALASEIIPL